jgi:hypothetical protein
MLVCGMCLASLSAYSALADENDLSNGVFIAHYVPEIVWTETLDPCEAYEAHAISSAEEQLNRIDTDSLSTWFVLSAWCEDKCFLTFQFGFGDYEPAAYAIYRFGACAPGEYLELSGPGWPCPNTGTAVTAAQAGISWEGNYLPIYYFSGYSYGLETVIPLGLDPSAYPFGGWVNCLPPPELESFPAAAFGGMGINTDGIYAEPPAPSAAMNTTWGAIRSIYSE